MRTHRHPTAIALAFSIAALALVAPGTRFGVAGAQEKYGALERGYRTGYSDGYQSGWADQLKGAPSDFHGKSDYRRADRAYIAAYGSIDDYRDGYQQGYEVGYKAGFSRGGFDSNLPAGGVTRRGPTARETADEDESASGGRNTGVSDSIPRGGSVPASIPTATGLSPVASDTTLLVELRSRLSTDVSQRGDRFEAQVVEPKDMAGAIIVGHLADVRRPGKTGGRALLQLEFDRIQMPGESDFRDFHAQLIEVVQAGGDTGVADVDPEGGVRGKSETKNDAVKVGAGAGIGAIIGGIAGGGRGAAIGAIIGGGAGTARVMTQRGKDIHLEPGQQLRLRSTGRAR